jgi:hypothetical protein
MQPPRFAYPRPRSIANVKQVEAVCRHLSADLADAVRFMF